MSFLAALAKPSLLDKLNDSSIIFSRLCCESNGTSIRSTTSDSKSARLDFGKLESSYDILSISTPSLPIVAFACAIFHLNLFKVLTR